MNLFLNKIHHRDSVINITFRLILSNQQDSNISNKKINLTKKSILKKILIARFIFSLLLVGLPLSAQASAFSFVTDFFNSSKPIVVETDSSINSQNMALLQASVNSDPNPAKGGGGITIVGGTALLAETGPSGSMADITDQPSNGQISVYLVRKGDSLSQIAKMFGVSINTIIWANNLHNNIIKEGQTLVILPITGVEHTIKKGETIVSISKKYKGDINEIMQFNNLNISSKLTVGNIIIIPDGDIISYNYSSRKKRYSSRKKWGRNGSNPYRGGSGPYYPGYYIRPVKGVITQGLHGYNAIDFGAPIGTPIVASATGVVIISRNYGWNGGYGSYVVLKHNNRTQTLYAHMSKNISYVGQHVVQGQVIGYVGSTGKSTGPHVHFEVRGAKNPFAKY